MLFLATDNDGYWQVVEEMHGADNLVHTRFGSYRKARAHMDWMCATQGYTTIEDCE